MWTMGCSDGNGFNMSDSFNGRKLRPLIPKPTAPTTTTTSPTSNNNNTATTIPHCLSCLHDNDLFALNHHMAAVMEQGKKDYNTQPMVSSRWNPTPEQLSTLEELYRRGTRTPTADQIQHITAQLRRFGKIEGKNVFYWFQNHKARERQKRRRRSESAAAEEQQGMESLERKEYGFEVEQAKNWALPTNCSTFAEESVSMQSAAMAAAAVAESGTDGWIQFEEGELQQRRSSAERYATWQMMQLSCSPPTHLLNTTTNTATTTTIAAEAEAIRRTDLKFINAQNFNIIIAPNGEDFMGYGYDRFMDEEECRESQTLQLFPLGSDESNGSDNVDKETQQPILSINTNFSTPYQFFEFLPLKI